MSANKIRRSVKGPSIKVLVRVQQNEISQIELIVHQHQGLAWEIITEDPLEPSLERSIHHWMEDYANGKRSQILLPLAFGHLPPFTAAVLKALQSLPFGKTVSYQELAEKVGNPHGARAVGNACGRNPYLLLVPCHRVLARNGLGGFSSGLEIKKELLAFENQLRERL